MKKTTFLILTFFIIISFSLNGFANEDDILMDQVENNYDIPDQSGPVENLPWRNKEEFQDWKDKHNTPFLLAGFCAVLTDPLPGEEFNVKLASEKISKYVIKPNQTFSQNSVLGPYDKDNGYKEGAAYTGGNVIMSEGGGVCKIAGTLYNLSVLSDLEIIERHNHSMAINYLPHGQDATVAYGIKDFKFKNTTSDNILIWSQLIENRLYMGFYGAKPSPVVKWHHEVLDTKDKSTKYIKNEKLNSGEMNTITNGLDGVTVKSIVDIEYMDGSTSTRNMGISQYNPLPKLIEIN
ncbi:MAG TPA: VanW family protein [Tissierellaceae bacterium]|nr:VanW family protein [Tissierellaceae bacterium]